MSRYEESVNQLLGAYPGPNNSAKAVAFVRANGGEHYSYDQQHEEAAKLLSRIRAEAYGGVGLSNNARPTSSRMDFGACVVEQRSGGLDEMGARRVCGHIYSKAAQGTHVAAEDARQALGIGGAPAHAPHTPAPDAASVALALYPGRNDTERMMSYVRANGGDRLTFDECHEQASRLLAKRNRGTMTARPGVVHQQAAPQVVSPVLRQLDANGYGASFGPVRQGNAPAPAPSINLDLYPGRNVTERAMSYVRANGGQHLDFDSCHEQACRLLDTIRGGRAA